MITSPPEKPGGQATPELAFDDWVICWHGRDGYEYLIGYPESSVRAGLDLNIPLKNAQGRELELANDSLKMCLLNGEWYGFPEPSPWFPEVSHIRLVDGGILACSDSPGCQGMQWTLLPEGYFPSGAPELQPPTEAGLHVIAFKRSL
jgi:hypothetical protein